MNIPSFLDRSAFFLNDENYDLISNTKVTLIGLGGVGGQLFLTLVRMGFENFKLADNGIFDEPDLNRQSLATRNVIGKKKIYEYLMFAKNINPNINIQIYSKGLTLDNVHTFFEDTDILIRAMDYEKGEEVKSKFTEILKQHNLPLFQSSVLGYCGLVQNFYPGDMDQETFWNMFKDKDMLSIIESGDVVKLMKEKIETNKFPTTCIGANFSSTLLANEIISYVLKDTEFFNRQTIFVPNFICINPRTLKLSVMNIYNIGN